MNNNFDKPKNSKSQIFESVYPVLQNKKKNSNFDDIMNNDPFSPTQHDRKASKTQRSASRSEKAVPSINSLIDPNNKLGLP